MAVALPMQLGWQFFIDDCVCTYFIDKLLNTHRNDNITRSRAPVRPTLPPPTQVLHCTVLYLHDIALNNNGHLLDE